MSYVELYTTAWNCAICTYEKFGFLCDTNFKGEYENGDEKIKFILYFDKTNQNEIQRLYANNYVYYCLRCINLAGEKCVMCEG